MNKTGIIKEENLDFYTFRNKSLLFNEIKKVISDSIKLLHRPNPEHRLKGLEQLHKLISDLSKDNTKLAKLAFEATQLDEQLLLTNNLCNLLDSNPPCTTLGIEAKTYWTQQTEKCLLILQGIVCFCPEVSEYFLNLANFKVVINLICCENFQIAMDALETTQCILAISPEHIRSFEEANGIQEILCLVKKKKSQTELRWKTLEFLFFYLLPEHDRSQKMDQSLIKSSEEKQEFIAQLLGQVFVNELQKIFSF